MDRRWGGLVILVIALVAAFAGAARSKPIAGTASLAPIPGPPAVGDCLLEPAPNGAGSSRREDDVVPALRIEACTGPRYGEVMAVIERQDRSRSGTLRDPPMDPCRRVFDDYLGAIERTELDRWSGRSFADQLAVPTALQRSQGQDWVACLVVPMGRPETARYTGTLRDVLRTRSYPSEFADCLPSLRLGDLPMHLAADCRTPHPGELLGWLTLDRTEVRSSALRSSCTALAVDLTGLADPTAGGRLQLDVRTSTTSLMMWTVDDGRGSIRVDGPEAAEGPVFEVYCLLVPTAGKMLTGPLLGLADGPLPVG